MKKPSDKWIPWYFVAFFVVIAIVDGIFVTVAVSTHTGVIVENAYQKGLDYNQSIAAVEKQEQLGWQGNIALVGSTLSFYLTDKQNHAIDEAMVTAYFSRVMNAGDDFSVKLPHSANGVYNDNISFPFKGQWDVRIAAQWNQQHYQQSKRITVR